MESDPAPEMTVERGLVFWQGLAAASPHGCRIHIGGGEPFGRWERLIGLAEAAWREGLSKPGGAGPLEAVETNAYWATSPAVVRERLAALDAAGMGRLTISADPYHQQFVPIARVRLAAAVAEEVLGAARVRVRWRDWLAEGFDTGDLDAARRQEVFAAWLARGRERLSGRAAVELAPLLSQDSGLGATGKAVFFARVDEDTPTRTAIPMYIGTWRGTSEMPVAPIFKSPSEFADKPCAEPLLRSRHVHVDGSGTACGGTCAGIVLGRFDQAASVAQAWRDLSERFAEMPIVGRLARSGPVGLLELAMAEGFVPAAGYAGKCHLCWEIRRWMFTSGRWKGYLAPGVVYEPNS